MAVTTTRAVIAAAGVLVTAARYISATHEVYPASRATRDAGQSACDAGPQDQKE